MKMDLLIRTDSADMGEEVGRGVRCLLGVEADADLLSPFCLHCVVFVEICIRLSHIRRHYHLKPDTKPVHISTLQTFNTHPSPSLILELPKTELKIQLNHEKWKANQESV